MDSVKAGPFYNGLETVLLLYRKKKPTHQNQKNRYNRTIHYFKH
jgi:hypothetical protein